MMPDALETCFPLRSGCGNTTTLAMPVGDDFDGAWRHPHKRAEKLSNPKKFIRLTHLCCLAPINAQVYPQVLCKNYLVGAL
jgi:hypothetical protein